MTHTPGPWTIDGQRIQRVKRDQAGLVVDLVCRINDAATAATAANALLIAAAPAMLEALREIEQIADDRADADNGIPNDWMRVLVIANDAIAKAVGGS